MQAILNEKGDNLVKNGSKIDKNKPKAPKNSRFRAVLKKIFAPFKFLRPIGQYFAGSWHELRLVRWPNRRATWGLTAAVLLFSAFFVVLIVLLDLAFKTLFELILK